MANRTAFFIGVFVMAASLRAAAPADACSLLPPDAIRQTMGETLAATKAASRSQCVYTLPTFANSISVTLTTGSREQWERWFHDAEERGGEEKEAAAKALPVEGIGDEAYWVHSFVGNLYVRKGNRFLRISLGGKLTDDERQAKAKALAAAALRQLR